MLLRIGNLLLPVQKQDVTIRRHKRLLELEDVYHSSSSLARLLRLYDLHQVAHFSGMRVFPTENGGTLQNVASIDART